MDKRRSRLCLIAALLCAVVVLVACNSPQGTHLSTAPAERLDLRLKFTYFRTPPGQVIVEVTVLSAAGPGEVIVALADNQRLTINGHSKDPSPLLNCCLYRFTVPRPAAGENYTIVYTDERGQQTSVVAPAPQHDLTITAPAAYAQVPIPARGAQLAVRYTPPGFFPPTSQVGKPLYTEIDAGVEGSCRVAKGDGIPASAPTCLNISSGKLSNAQPDETASAVISDRDEPAYGFGNLAPGPGKLYVGVNVDGDLPDLPPGGFASVWVSVRDLTSIPITWV
jgi:hypothetical protein